MPVIDFIKNTVAPLQDRPVSERLHHVIQKLATLGIKAHYDPAPVEQNGRASPTRVLLYSSRYNARNYQLASECNGLILDYTTWEVVYRPPELPNSQFTVTRVAENFHEYDVFALNDGTVVGLYYYLGSWRICTARGLDMAATPLMGPNPDKVTYQQAVEQAMAAAKFPHPADHEAAAAGEIEAPCPRALQWDELDVDASYTVGFTHPAAHFSKFTGMWIIRAVVTTSNVAIDTHQYEIPEQQRIAAGEGTNFPTLRSIQQACADTNYPGWGFMLRSRSPDVTGADSTVLLESRRMALVRQLVYDRHMDQDAAAFGVTREQLAFTRCLIDQRVGYIRLYPERAELQARAVESLNRVADQVIGDENKRKQKNTAAWLRAHIARTRDPSRMTRAQVLDFMLTREHISVLLRHLQQAALLPVE
jgi:hypothetical protein